MTIASVRACSSAFVLSIAGVALVELGLAQHTVGTLDKRRMLDSIRQDINVFRDANHLDRVVMLWCASTETFIEPRGAHADLGAFEAAIDANDPTSHPPCSTPTRRCWRAYRSRTVRRASRLTPVPSSPALVRGARRRGMRVEAGRSGGPFA